MCSPEHHGDQGDDGSVLKSTGSDTSSRVERFIIDRNSRFRGIRHLWSPWALVCQEERRELISASQHTAWCKSCENIPAKPGESHPLVDNWKFPGWGLPVGPMLWLNLTQEVLGYPQKLCLLEDEIYIFPSPQLPHIDLLIVASCLGLEGITRD